MQRWLVLMAKGIKPEMVGARMGKGVTFSSGGRLSSSMSSSTSSKNNLMWASSSAVQRTALVLGLESSRVGEHVG